jgi:hypothetical protein
MQTHYLIEVSYKFSEFVGFKQIVPPVLVNKTRALAMVGEYGVYKGDNGVRRGMARLYSQEHVYPFVRLLILDSTALIGSVRRIAELVEEVASKPEFLQNLPSDAVLLETTTPCIAHP